MAEDQPKPLRERIREASTLGGKLLSEVTEEDWASYREMQRARWIIADPQWARLQQMSAIPDSDRVHVETALRIYRNTQGDRLGTPTLTPAETREQLYKIAVSAESLRDDIDRALDNDLAVRVLSGPRDKVWENVAVWQLMELLTEFGNMVRSAAQRCERGRPGPINDNLWGLIDTLAHLWMESTGEPLSISKRGCGPNHKWNALNFIIEAVQIADSKMKGEDARVRDIVKNMARSARSSES